MAFLSGARLTAARLNRLQAKTYRTTGTVLQSGPITGVDVTSCTVTFTTETDSATAVVNCHWDFDLSGATTSLASGRLMVDGVGESQFATFQAGVATDRGTMSQTYRVSLGTAGSHTLKLQVTLPTNMDLQGLYTTLTATVHEVA